MMLTFIMADAACVWTVRGENTLQASSAYLLATAKHQCIRWCNWVALNPFYTVKGTCSKINILLEIVLTLWHKYTLLCPMHSSCSCTEVNKNIWLTKQRLQITASKKKKKIQKEGNNVFFLHPRCELQWVQCTLKATLKWLKCQNWQWTTEMLTPQLLRGFVPCFLLATYNWGCHYFLSI